MVNGKSGASHFEMIISFIFFVGFVFFLFLFLKPYETTVLSGSVVAALYDTFEEEVHTNLTSIFLKADHSTPSACFNITLPDKIFAYSFTNSRVTNLSDVLRNSELQSEGDLNIDADDVYYRVDISPVFVDETLGLCEEVESPYILGSKLERRVISYSALEDLKERYELDYKNLKNDLRVPEAFEFFIVSEELPEGINMKNFVPSSVDVITYDYLSEVLKDDGEIINARFTLGVW